MFMTGLVAGPCHLVAEKCTTDTCLDIQHRSVYNHVKYFAIPEIFLIVIGTLFIILAMKQQQLELSATWTKGLMSGGICCFAGIALMETVFIGLASTG